MRCDTRTSAEVKKRRRKWSMFTKVTYKGSLSKASTRGHRDTTPHVLPTNLHMSQMQKRQSQSTVRNAHIRVSAPSTTYCSFCFPFDYGLIIVLQLSRFLQFLAPLLVKCDIRGSCATTLYSSTSASFPSLSISSLLIHHWYGLNPSLLYMPRKVVGNFFRHDAQ